jgi:hypothetical protein
VSGLRVLVAPAPGSSSDLAGAWEDLRAALQPLVAIGTIQMGRVQASEAGIAAELARGWDVLHLVSAIRGPQQYGTFVLEGAEGAQRGVTAEFLGKLVARFPSVLVCAQSPLGDEPLRARMVAKVVESGVQGAVGAGAGSARAKAFYASLAAGQSLEQAARASGGWVDAIAGQFAPRVAVVRDAEPASPPPLPAPIETGNFDVFLCHNVVDKPEVRAIAHRLIDEGIRPWLDEWELPPGMPWRPLLEENIGRMHSAAVFVGADGLGPWQTLELDALLRELTRRQCAVIPVLLPSAQVEPKLPLFLQSIGWVDFRSSEPDPMIRLRWGITGQRPPRRP